MLSTLGRYVSRHHVALLALFLALGGTSYAATGGFVGAGGKIRGCVKKSNGTLRLIRSGKCRKSETAITLSNAPGAKGATGATGAPGPQGAAGAPAAAGVVTRINDSDGNGVTVAAGANFTASVSCNPAEIAVGGGGVSGLGGDPNQPVAFVTVAASRPTPGTGTPTGWTVSFRNDDSASHILGHKVYVNCLIPGS
jgi:hypothetical protein